MIELDFLFFLNNWLGFLGEMPDFAPVEMLFVNLFGVLALMWTMCRLYRYNEQFLGWDLLLRSTVSILLAYYALAQDVHQLILLFLVVELFLVTGYSVLMWRKMTSIRLKRAEK